MAEPTDVERGLKVLEAEIKRLEAEYNMYFSGRLPKPPWETRGRVDAMVKQLDRSFIQNYGDRFRFNTLQSRYASLVDLWDRGLRAREEGRAGPFAHRRTTSVDVQKRRHRAVPIRNRFDLGHRPPPSRPATSAPNSPGGFRSVSARMSAATTSKAPASCVVRAKSS